MMQNKLNGIGKIHRFLATEAFYPLMLATLLTGLLLVVRIYLNRSGAYGSHEQYRYVFLVWNLFLAWIPYGFSLMVGWLHYHYPNRLLPLLPLAAIWLLFFPNAPYIVTDLIHLRQGSWFPLWYDVGLIATFAWTGCFLAIVSLNLMQRVVKAFTNTVISWLFVVVVLLLNGFGIYLGRFGRWNSWDILHNSNPLMADVVAPMVDPANNLQAVGVTLMFSAFLFICYLMFISIRGIAHQNSAPTLAEVRVVEDDFSWQQMESPQVKHSAQATQPTHSSTETEWVLSDWPRG
jgi:uncharacterized membrane protein